MSEVKQTRNQWPLQLEEACVYYVYELADPRDDLVFYVGKGKRNRIDAHEAEAAKGVCSEKTRKIKDIQAAGFSITKRKVAFFFDEQSAYDHETDRIDFYGLENLTNILPGGQVAWTRRKQDRATRLKVGKPFDVLLAELKGESAIFRCMSEWFRTGGHVGTKYTLSAPPDIGGVRFCLAVSDSFYNVMAPWLWKTVRTDEKLLRLFTEKMRPHGVEVISYGSA